MMQASPSQRGGSQPGTTLPRINLENGGSKKKARGTKQHMVCGSSAGVVLPYNIDLDWMPHPLLCGPGIPRLTAVHFPGHAPCSRPLPDIPTQFPGCLGTERVESLRRLFLALNLDSGSCQSWHPDFTGCNLDKLGKLRTKTLRHGNAPKRTGGDEKAIMTVHLDHDTLASESSSV